MYNGWENIGQKVGSDYLQLVVYRFKTSSLCSSMFFLAFYLY